MPEFDNICQFIYAEDLAFPNQVETFVEAANNLSEALDQLGKHYADTGLTANPDRTVVCAYHLKKSQVNSILKVQKEKELMHEDAPC